MKFLTRTTAPTLEPVSVEEAAAFLRVTDTDESPQIEAMISTAREMVENFTGRAMLTQQWKLTLSDWPCEAIQLDRAPLASVQTLKYYPASGAAQATLSAATYYHALTGPVPGLIVLKTDQSWPDIYDRPDAVEINFTAGAATVDEVPSVLRHAVLLALSHLYENRTPLNIGNIVNELPFSLKYMLESQRVGGWVV